jgi:hypothetical protein
MKLLKGEIKVGRGADDVAVARCHGANRDLLLPSCPFVRIAVLVESNVQGKASRLATTFEFVEEMKLGRFGILPKVG